MSIFEYIFVYLQISIYFKQMMADRYNNVVVQWIEVRQYILTDVYLHKKYLKIDTVVQFYCMHKNEHHSITMKGIVSSPLCLKLPLLRFTMHMRAEHLILIHAYASECVFICMHPNAYKYLCTAIFGACYIDKCNELEINQIAML